MSDEAIRAPRERDGRSLFIQGYFGDRILNGDIPNYGYPANHVPETNSPPMKVITGYIAALISHK